MNGKVNTKEQEILDDLCIKFVGRAREKLTDISAEIDEIHASSCPGDLETVFSEIHTLKGQGGTFGFSDFSSIAACLEDYLEGLTEMSDQHHDDLKIFVTRLNDCIVRECYPSKSELDQILSELPTR